MYIFFLDFQNHEQNQSTNMVIKTQDKIYSLTLRPFSNFCKSLHFHMCCGQVFFSSRQSWIYPFCKLFWIDCWFLISGIQIPASGNSNFKISPTISAYSIEAFGPFVDFRHVDDCLHWFVFFFFYQHMFMNTFWIQAFIFIQLKSV